MVMMSAFPHRHHTAVRHLTFHVLELDRGMVDAEFIVQRVFYVAEDPFTDRRRNVRNCNMTGKRVRL
jgi:hypothetical protein